MTRPRTAPFAPSALRCVVWVVDVRLPSPPTLDSRVVSFTSSAWSRVLTAVNCCARQRLVRLAIRKVPARLWPRTFSTREPGRFWIWDFRFCIGLQLSADLQGSHTSQNGRCMRHPSSSKSSAGPSRLAIHYSLFVAPMPSTVHRLPSSLPLSGKRIVITRRREQSGELRRALVALGADVTEFPTIEIRNPASWEPLDKAIRRLTEFDYLLFTSVNGVLSFLARLRACGGDVRDLPGLQVGAVGPATAAALVQAGVSVD